MPRRITPWLAFFVLLLGVPACGGGSWSYDVVGTARDPGAEGHLQIERIEGGNRLVTATLTHMTPPDRLGSGITTFVMWFRNAQGRSTMASLLEYDPDSRTARATATTPMSTFVVVITAERNANAAEPSENVLFTQRVAAE
jgi:hypothetical protein